MNERIKSRAAFEDAQTVIPGGVNSPVRALKSVGTTPLFVSSAMGPHITDIDSINPIAKVASFFIVYTPSKD